MNSSTFLFDFLKKRNWHLASYVAKIVFIALVPTIVISLAVYYYFGGVGSDEDSAFSIMDAFGLVIFAPIVETGFIMAIVWALRCAGLRSTDFLILVTASLMAGLHSLFLAYWGLIVFWNFCVWTAVFIDWEARSRIKAFWAASFFHAINNSIPAFVPLVY